MNWLERWLQHRRELESMKALVRAHALERLIKAERRLEGLEAELASLTRHRKDDVA